MEIKRLIEEFDEETIRSFVQKNSDYYLAKWKIMAASGSKFSWNWAAFLATAPWIGYRKMYFYAFIYILLNVLTVIPFIGILIWLGLWFGIGAVGNYLYGKFTYNKLTQLRTAFPDENEFKAQVVKAGGTSIGGIFIVLLMTIAISVVLVLISYSMMGNYTYTNF
ncbi:DUF2628 domain-containing protein [Hydrogenivirga sp. 128-5-R1-1]|uniref:DUF2628 domain-containing protein n=1 Tax=Hydrogenivirga sp. 128-5-R1-1 TaxID=392423 RepID=UPI00015F263C|nr:DUF2628 domain-containing protein [Hydrogenivirga sp. 128-5-R1-1]EDP73346.1 hypothetical protein HG1285_11343 [Hydrogenivirga sp. 128-5-R1-1]